MKDIQEIDEKLKSLGPEEVIDCSDLDKKKGNLLCRYYGNKYNTNGPFVDNAHLGKYFVVFSLKSKEIENA